MRRFDRTIDEGTLREWMSLYKGKIRDMDQIPDVGFVAENAMAFILEIEKPKVCFLDPLIGNRKNKEGRDRDLPLVIEACCDYAKSHGHQAIFALADNPHSIKRGEAQMFHVKQSMKFLVRDL